MPDQNDSKASAQFEIFASVRGFCIVGISSRQPVKASVAASATKRSRM